MTRHKALTSSAIVISLVLVLEPSVRAIFLQPQLEQVPIERLIRNLEGLVEKEPQNIALRINLARAHAMAFANGGADVSVQRGQQGLDERSGVWFGPTASHVPFRNAIPSAPPPRSVENAHLTAAIRHYEQAVRMDAGNSIARLGYGWCLDRAGEKPRAVEAYRRVIADMWPREQKGRGFMASPGPVTVEAVGYLLPLLDPVNDRAEIDRLRGYVEELEKQPRMITPIAVSLVGDSDASRLVDRSARVRFDADGSGFDRQWTWISKDAGWLVYDQLGTQQISSALQLFGNVTFWMFWDNGYDALRVLDDDRNGELAGGELAGLAIWRDVDGDGVSDPGEVEALASWGIVALSCAYETEDESDTYVAWSRTGIRFADGSTRPTYDVLLHRR